VSVVDGDTLSATYVDADDGQGGQNLARTTTAVIDCRAPIITNVAAGLVTGDSARITWSTDEPATSAVRYGPDGSSRRGDGPPRPVTAHAVTLNGLAECTTYVYAVESSDTVGNLAQSDGGGSYETFTTDGIRSQFMPARTVRSRSRTICRRERRARSSCPTTSSSRASRSW
jgi:hypothetical protein